MPLNIALTTGSAKAGTDDGQGANAKYTCSGFTDRLTDRYPLCPQGSSLMRVFDFPSCWNGQDLDSEDHTSHIVFPDDDGECRDDAIPVPALRITVSYDDMPPGRLFAIDSFPEQQHDPLTDHALLEYLASERRADEGAACINAARRCLQGPEQDGTAAGSADPADQVPPSQGFAHALATHATAHRSHPVLAARGQGAGQGAGHDAAHAGGHVGAHASDHTAGHADGHPAPASRPAPGALAGAVTGSVARTAPATLPVTEGLARPGGLPAVGPFGALGPLPGVTPLPALAAPLTVGSGAPGGT
jgi:hypothetical protein